MKQLISGSLVFVLTITIGVFGLFLLCGCDTGEGTVALSVSPAEARLSGSTNSVMFTVGGVTNVQSGLRPLSLPLEWTVSDPSLGHIGAAGGYSAEYVTSGNNGMNVVTVRDQYGAEGVATVWQ